MHAAPPLRVGWARNGGWIAFVCATTALAAANLAAWVALHLALTAPVVAVLACLAAALAAGLAFAGAWHAQSRTPLDWDGAQWHCDGVSGDVQVALDLDRWLLLCFAPHGRGRPRWLVASRSTVTGAWSALRGALYSRRPADATDAPAA